MSEQLQALRVDRENDRADRENGKEAIQAQIQVLQSATATPTATPSHQELGLSPSDLEQGINPKGLTNTLLFQPPRLEQKEIYIIILKSP